MQKRWKLLQEKIPNSINEIVDMLLRNRNITEKNQFFACSLDSVNYDIGDMQSSVERIYKAITNQEQIIVFGDYDADGLCSSTILWETLHSLGAKARPYIPHREKEGYGLSQSALENVIMEYNPSLIITVDNGISAKKEIAYAKEKGIDVIVTDHHAAPTELPECLIIHDHHVSGSAVAYKLSQKIVADAPADKAAFVPQDHLALVAIGTICDIIPLSIENRALVKHGIKILQTTTRPGIKALCEIAAVDQKNIDTYHIGFIIGPRLNAQGRLDHSMNALRLLCARNLTQATQLAMTINAVNNDRKSLTKEIAYEAMIEATQAESDKIIIVGKPDWNPGVIGLIASHLVKEFNKPAIVWGSSDEHPDVYKASARSIDGFHITDAIRLQKELLMGHGGHPMAAGLSVHKNNLEQFSMQIKAFAQQSISEEMLIPQLTIDADTPFEYLTNELYEHIQTLSPFGAQHSEPIFRAKNYFIHEAKTVGKQNDHLKLKVSPDKNTKPLDAVLWGKGSILNELQDSISLAYKLEQNTWNGRTSMQLNAVDYQI